jgi:serine O-acetyltransferase
MTFARYRHLVFSDLYRVGGRTGWRAAWREARRGEEGFAYCFWMRTCAFLKSRPLAKYFLYPLARRIMRRLMYRYGISIEFTTQIGPGFYIGHYGGIVVNPRVKIGRDCNISQGVTLGIANRGEHAGCPTIGDRVFIGPGAVIFGNITVGSGAAIGANAVVTRDVPENAVAAGIPARILSPKGSEGYINRTDYPTILGDEPKE